MISLAPPFTKALPVMHKIEAAGFEAYFVGGSVRDTLLHQPINDVDIATSALPEEIKAIFPKTVDVGIEHGTVMVLWKGEHYEITTFRTESTYQDFRRPDEVTFVRSLKEDLKRRDFTVNALAMDQKGNIIDYFDGQTDLVNKVIRAVGSPRERFYEDALRMMRAVRFISQLGFKMEKETIAAIEENHALLEKIAVERIQVEFLKMLMGIGRKNGLLIFIETGLFQYCPGLRKHEKALKAFAKNQLNLSTSLSAWTLLLFYLALESEEVDPFLRAWKCSRKEIQQVETAYRALKVRMNRSLDRLELYQTGLEIALEVERMAESLGLPVYPLQVKETYESLPIKSKKALAITGNDLISSLKIQPSREIGLLLEKAEKAVLEEKVDNETIQILNWLKEEN